MQDHKNMFYSKTEKHTAVRHLLTKFFFSFGLCLLNVFTLICQAPSGQYGQVGAPVCCSGIPLLLLNGMFKIFPV
jgi:hypothetical protein